MLSISRRRSSPVLIGSKDGGHHRRFLAGALQALVSERLSGRQPEATRSRYRQGPSYSGGTNTTLLLSVAELAMTEYAVILRSYLADRSPKWNFDDAQFERTAASFDNPDHVPS